VSAGERTFELPEDLQPVMKKAKRLEWLTIAYMLSAVVFVGVTLGQSQAMKAAWIEDLLGFLPPAAFLIAARIRTRSATGQFPWGRHRAVSISFLVAAFALLVMGVYVFLDSAIKLAYAEHAPIGVIPLFGHEVWLGWVMLVALFWSGAPSVLLGIRKRKLGDQLHDKVLFADAEMNRADWMTVVAAMLGVIGIGLGFWWADSVAAIFIAQDIIRDGWRTVRAATHDLMDARPRRHDNSEYHPVVEQMQHEAESAPWVKQAAVRLREEGHVFTGEVLVVPKDEEDLVEHLDDLTEHLTELDWKVHDLVVAPVTEIDVPEPNEGGGDGDGDGD
jgi:cation diffusion facilitator family transporter